MFYKNLYCRHISYSRVYLTHTDVIEGGWRGMEQKNINNNNNVRMSEIKRAEISHNCQFAPFISLKLNMLIFIVVLTSTSGE
jgi:hypothetical protein